jgi:hypothetical protein
MDDKLGRRQADRNALSTADRNALSSFSLTPSENELAREIYLTLTRVNAKACC